MRKQGGDRVRQMLVAAEQQPTGVLIFTLLAWGRHSTNICD